TLRARNQYPDRASFRRRRRKFGTRRQSSARRRARREVPHRVRDDTYDDRRIPCAINARVRRRPPDVQLFPAAVLDPDEPRLVRGARRRGRGQGGDDGRLGRAPTRDALRITEFDAARRPTRQLLTSRRSFAFVSALPPDYDADPDRWQSWSPPHDVHD